LSIVVVVHDMPREAPRTLYSMSAAYQRGADPRDYEVVVVDNGSAEPLARDMVEGLGDNFRYFLLEDPPPSPAFAVNFGARQARGDFLAVAIDGARLFSPGMVRLALMALVAFPRPVITSLGFHLGSALQMESLAAGYDAEEEDRLLVGIDWPHDGYRLFEVSALAGSSRYGWFQPLSESNCLFLSRELFEELGGLDERFVEPGGGFVNLDFYYRSCGMPRSTLLMLLGEGTFHQVHGGIMSNATPSEGDRRLASYEAEHRRLRGRPFTLPARRPILFGDVPPAALGWVKRSCELFGDCPPASDDS
jgi:hypothetical protein